MKRQSIMLDKKLSIEEWLLQLKEESVLKLEGIESAKIGFGPKESKEGEKSPSFYQ